MFKIIFIWRVRTSHCAEEMHHIPRAGQDSSTWAVDGNGKSWLLSHFHFLHYSRISNFHRFNHGEIGLISCGHVKGGVGLLAVIWCIHIRQEEYGWEWGISSRDIDIYDQHWKMHWMWIWFGVCLNFTMPLS